MRNLRSLVRESPEEGMTIPKMTKIFPTLTKTDVKGEWILKWLELI